MKHTAGPWMISYNSGIDYRIHAHSNGNICESILNNPTTEVLDEYQEEQYANALLIHAAPDLLEAVQELVKANAKMAQWIVSNEPEDKMAFTGLQAHAIGLAAIKKATE
jgi:hypothetical protein